MSMFMGPAEPGRKRHGSAIMNLLRDRDQKSEKSVGFVELFFDLVFVFAITQLAHHLVEHLSWIDALETLILLLAVWWLWIGTSWVTNWLSPDHVNVRIMLFALMAISLLMGAAIPDAFGNKGLVFAVAYSGAKIARSLFVVLLMQEAGESALRQNFTRVTIWSVLSSPFWLLGGLADEDARMAWWATAILIDYSGPIRGYALPWLGRSSRGDWDIVGDHLAERCALFIIIALGETIIITGSTYGKSAQTAEQLTALVVAICCSAAMWWIYFDVGAKRAANKLNDARDAGALARYAYMFLHVPIIAGIILTAVADEKALQAPLNDADPPSLAAAAGGTALFLIGVMLFKQSTATNGRPPTSHLIGIVLAGLLVFLGSGLPLLVINGLTFFILACVSVLERLLRSEPTPHADNPDIVVEIET
jgi:low temperature requirement protein LtrA